MTLPEIDPDPPRQLGTDFARRGPWGAHFARSGNNNKTTKGTDGDLTRRWAHGPANFSLSAEGVLPKDRFEFLSPDGSRWRPQSEKGGFPQEFLRKKPLISFGKQAFLENRSFASKDGWGTSSGRLGATPTGPGGETARLKKSL